MNTVSLVIPVFNRWRLTAACLRAVARTRGEVDVEAVVVDNGSTDETARELDTVGERLGLRVVVVRQPTNLGFGPGSNAGLAAATGDVVVFLNNDTEACPGWLPPIVRALDDPTIGAVGALLWYPGRIRTVQHAGIVWTPTKKSFHLYRHRQRHHEPGIGRAKDLQCVTGACLGMRTRDAIALGGFDDAFINSFEDIDLCFRVRFELGLRVRYDPAIELLHHESQTEGRFLRDDENERRFLERWADRVVGDGPRVMAEDRAVDDGSRSSPTPG